MFSSDTICYFNAGSSDTAELLGNYLSKILIKNGFSDIAPVLLCIGSDRVTGDSLGPMVGSPLEERYKKSIPVFGTLKMPVHALNLESPYLSCAKYIPRRGGDDRQLGKQLLRIRFGNERESCGN